MHEAVPYPIQTIPTEVERIDEVLGTKRKFWYDDENTGARSLFKLGRPGEDWAEKVACELANLLGLPAAQVEFTTHNNKDGVSIRSFLAGSQTFAHGNELLHEANSAYAKHDSYGATGYNVAAVLAALKDLDVKAPRRHCPNQKTFELSSSRTCS